MHTRLARRARFHDRKSAVLAPGKSEMSMGDYWEDFTWIVPVERWMPLQLHGEHVVYPERCARVLPFLRLVFAFSITSSTP